MRRHHTPTFPALSAFALAALCVAGCDADAPDARPDVDAPADTVSALGPADGTTLPATDTGRVAVGDTAPDFTLPDRRGEPVTLSDLRGRRIILAFYRGHW